MRQRIVQAQVRRYLTGISVLLILWMLFRSAKYFIFWQPAAMRFLWYLFYLPMLAVPMLSLLVALSLGKPEGYRLPRATIVLWVITAGLLLLVLTNDLHEWVFAFPPGAVRTDRDYTYAALYFPVIGWQLLCAVATLVIMLLRCRVPSGRRRLLPVVPPAVSLAYTALHYLGVPWLRALFGDVTAFQSLMYILTFEACIECGFIRSNSRYADLFAASVDTSAAITDTNWKVRYAAVSAAPIAEADMRRAADAPIVLDDGRRLHTMPIGGGHAVWTEDVSALLTMKAESENLAEELQERNALLRYEYKRDAKRRAVEEQTRLYDLMQAGVQTQIDRIDALTRAYEAADDGTQAKSILSEIAVLCCYIKRREHLTLLADRDYKVPVAELTRAFSESLETLKLRGVTGVLYIEEGLPMLSGRTAAAVFDFYETAVEHALAGLRSVRVSLGAPDDTLRLSLRVGCTASLAALAAENIRYEKEDAEDEQLLVFLPEGRSAP